VNSTELRLVLLYSRTFWDACGLGRSFGGKSHPFGRNRRVPSGPRARRCDYRLFFDADLLISISINLLRSMFMGSKCLSVKPVSALSKEIRRARQMAKRNRAFAACLRCKSSKVKCADYRPCKRCANGGFECSGSSDYQTNTDGPPLNDEVLSMHKTSWSPDSINSPKKIINEELEANPGPTGPSNMPVSLDVSHIQQLLPGFHTLFSPQNEFYTPMGGVGYPQARNLPFALPISMPSEASVVAPNPFLPPILSPLNNNYQPYSCASTQRLLALSHLF
jgi:hypothetical protein